MNEGYIKLYRQLRDNPLWQEKPFTRGQAWVDLIMLANYKDVKTVIKGQVVVIKRGQLLRGEDSLADEWGWSRGKVRRFLTQLEKEKMCSRNGTPLGTLISIENYEGFQCDRPSNGTADGTPDGTADGTGVKKEKKVKNKRGDFVPPSLAEVSKYVQEMNYAMDPKAFYDYYSETHWIKKNGQRIRDWKASVRTWERREKEFRKSGGKSSPAPIEPPKYKTLEPDVDPEKERPERGPITGMPEEMRSKLRPANN